MDMRLGVAGREACRIVGNAPRRRWRERIPAWCAPGLLAAAVSCGDDAPDDDVAAAVSFIAMPDGAPEATYWDAQHSLLYIVDNKANQVWTWRESSPDLSAVAKLPSPDGSDLPSNVTLGQAAMLGDGTFVVSRFGQPGGGFGGIGYIAPGEHEAQLVPNLDEGRRRLGLAVADDGTLYGSYFTGGMGGLTGFLTTVDLDNGETVVADGFGKIVGLAVQDGRLFVSDQSNGHIVDAPLDALPEHAEDWHELAKFTVPDQICVGPNGSLFSGQFQGAQGSDDPLAVRRIEADGGVTNFKADPDVSKPSGVSYDARGHRLFVADSGNSAKIGVHVFTVP